MSDNNSSTRPEVGKYPLIFTNGSYPYLQVFLFRIGQSENNQYILKLAGIDHTWDGHFFELTRNGDDKRADYSLNTPPEGVETYNLVTCREFYGGLSYQIYIEGIRDGLYLELGRDPYLNPEHLLTEYLEYKEAGKKPF